jgi:NADH-quinone oxidoreductase subunit N
MSVGAKVAGFAALGRLALYAFGDLWGEWVWVLVVLSALTMTVGNLTALRQANLKRMLAYSSIAHAGYILVGVAAGNEAGASAVLFYLFGYAFMNVGAFAVIIAVGHLEGNAGGGETLDDFSGLAARKPWLAATMALFMLSLAGMPPLVGFMGKLYVFGAAVEANLIWLAAIGVVNSVISAYYYLRVIVVMYMVERSEVEAGPSLVSRPLQVGVGLASVAIVVVGLWPVPILHLAQLSATALLGG